MIIFVLVLAAAAGLLAWVLIERPRIQYDALKAPRAVASALSSIAGGGAPSSQRRSAEESQPDLSVDPESQQREEDVEAVVRRHLYGARSR